MAMVENSGMGLSKDMAHHGNLSVGLGSLSPHWYHPSSLSSLSPNQVNIRSGPDPNTHPTPPSLSYHSPSLSSSSAKEASLLLPEKTKENRKEDQVGSQEQEKEREKDQEKEKEREREKDQEKDQEKERENCVDPQHEETESSGNNKKKVAGITPDPIRMEEGPLVDGGGIVVVRKPEEDRFSTLNPLAKEFVPPSKVVGPTTKALPDSEPVTKGNTNRRKKGNSNQGKRRINSRILKAQREESIRRTVYVSDIDQQVTEEQLAALFISCSQVVDCRICGDPNSALRFAFVEFTNEEGARAALGLSGTKLGFYPVRVLPSKTAIVPVNPTFLPRSEVERELCARTIYCTNIDKKVSQAEVKLFFETLCGEVSRLRLLGDFHHSTRIAFVEFIIAESAMYALNCSGAILGSSPIRVSPSKTPVRPCGPQSHPQ